MGKVTSDILLCVIAMLWTALVVLQLKRSGVTSIVIRPIQVNSDSNYAVRIVLIRSYRATVGDSSVSLVRKLFTGAGGEATEPSELTAQLPAELLAELQDETHALTKAVEGGGGRAPPSSGFDRIGRSMAGSLSSPQDRAPLVRLIVDVDGLQVTSARLRSGRPAALWMAVRTSDDERALERPLFCAYEGSKYAARAAWAPASWLYGDGVLRRLGGGARLGYLTCTIPHLRSDVASVSLTVQ